MSKDECNRLFDEAIANGWAEVEVNIAYFDARLGMDADLVHMAETSPESEQDA